MSTPPIPAGPEGSPSTGNVAGIDNELLKAVIDAIITLPPEYRAPLLMGFLLFLMFCLSRAFGDDKGDLSWGALLGMIVLFVIALIRKPPPSHPAFTRGQETRAKIILIDPLDPTNGEQ